jgi:hypothetical protein
VFSKACVRKGASITHNTNQSYTILPIIYKCKVHAVVCQPKAKKYQLLQLQKVISKKRSQSKLSYQEQFQSESRSELVGWRDRTMSSEHEKLACSKSPIHEESILKLSIDNTSLFAEESQQSGCSYRKVPIQESCLASKI